ncbi:hypothetical protein AAC387_Pa07g2825 [Persea americana]
MKKKKKKEKEKEIPWTDLGPGFIPHTKLSIRRKPGLDHDPEGDAIYEAPVVGDYGADAETVPKWGPQGNTPGFNPQEAVFRRRSSDVYSQEGHQPERFSNERSSHDLVEKMHYLFIRIVEARSLPSKSNPFVKISVSGTNDCSKPAWKTALFEWDQTFAFGGDAHESASTLEVSVWDPQPFSFAPPSGPDAAETCGDNFLGGICYDLSEIHLRDPPDIPLTQLGLMI